MDCENHDHSPTGECLVINWKSAVEEREGYEKKEALAHKTQEQQEEEIRYINQQNRKMVAESNKAPF